MPRNYDLGDRNKTSVESTVLDVWKAAAENGDSGEQSYEVGTDRYRKHTEDKTPGQGVKEEIEELKALIEELEEGIFKNIAKAAGKTAAHAVKAGAKKAGGAIKKKVGASKVGKFAKKVKSGAKKVKAVGKKIGAAAKSGTSYQSQEFDAMAEELKIIESKLNEYGAILEEEMANYKTNGQEQLSGLRETVLAMWQEAAKSAVNPNDREDLDDGKGATGEGGKKTAAKIKRADEPKPMVATEEMYRELDEKLTAKQKKIDVDGDGEIEGSDLAKLRKKAKKENKTELQVAQEFKVNSMKEALAKVWGLDEHKGDKPHKHPHEEEKKESVKKGKTETGKKPAVVELEPETQGK